MSNTSPPELRATARLQLHKGFDLRAAAAQVPYYAALGISHYYLSPIGAARAGSTHGYDVIDPTRVNPELGGEDALRELVATLRARDMGVIIDIVPNHMAADMANPWWRDVLANGRRSAYAHYFDIDWHAPETDGKLWLPILGQPLADTLAAGDIALGTDPHTGLRGLACAGRVLPLSAQSLSELGASTPTPERLATLIDQQHYRLAHWRSANDIVNYRRFFDITELVALAVEHNDVFDAVHALPLRLISEGLVDGLRIDHVDGLSRPTDYLRRLRRAMDRAAAERANTGAAVTLHVEKILADGEQLCAHWPVDGTTGYDFMDQAGAVLHDDDGAVQLRHAWHSVSGRPADFEAEEQLARGELLQTSLQSEYALASRAWHALAQSEPATQGLTRHALAQSLAEVLAQMRVYRTYLGPCGPNDEDRAALDHAFSGADAAGNPDRADARAALKHGLFSAPRDLPAGEQRTELHAAHRRFEQLAAPLNAKSVEDTGFYRHGVLLSRNEVGSDPRRMAMSVPAFHQAMRDRSEHWPHALLALATHDHKRGPDARARLAVLSERTAHCTQQAQAWIEELHQHSALPSGGDLWMALQSILGAWPLGLSVDDEPGMRAFAERLAAWQIKALREAKLHTRWTAPNEAYEAACQSTLRDLLLGTSLASLRQRVADAARALDAPGALNALAQLTLQLTAPGVPDIYQGADRWDQSLVDPDNRRPVDYAIRQALGDVALPDLLADFRDGRIKQALTQRLLQLRQRLPQALVHGAYRPLTVSGEHAMRVLAFARIAPAGDAVLVVVPRLCASALASGDSPHPAAAIWGNTSIACPDDLAHSGRSALVDAALSSSDGQWRLSALLAHFPVGVWQLDASKPD